MSDESKPKEKTFEFPMMPIFGVDLGERLGSLDARQKQMGTDLQKMDASLDSGIQKLNARIDKLESKIEAVDAKLTAKIEAVDGRVDKCLLAINRLDERLISLAESRKSDHNLLIGLWVTVIAGFILQFFFK